MTGVDIDPDLIRKAGTHLAFVNSLRDPTTGAADRFPLALPKEHGFVPPAMAREGDAEEAGANGEDGGFPANVEFVAADWVSEAIPADADGYDLVLACVPPLPLAPQGLPLTEATSQDALLTPPCSLDTVSFCRLSLTKWIHLHHADDGLLAFFAKIHRLVRPGGRLVLEPQAWSTYKDAVKKTRGAVPKARLAELALRPEAFGGALEALGFERDGVLRSAGEEERGDAAQAGGSLLVPCARSDEGAC